MNFIIRWIVTAISVAAAVWLVPGIEILSNSASWVGIVFFALILSLINMSIKPILQILSLPVTVLTLGIFYLVVNTLALHRRVARQRAVRRRLLHRQLRQRLCGLHRHLAGVRPRQRPHRQRRVISAAAPALAATRSQGGHFARHPSVFRHFQASGCRSFLRQAYQKTLTRRFSEKEKVK